MKGTLTNLLKIWFGLPRGKLSMAQAMLRMVVFIGFLVASVFLWYGWAQKSLPFGISNWSANGILVLEGILIVAAFVLRGQLNVKGETPPQPSSSKDVVATFFDVLKGTEDATTSQPVMVEPLFTRLGSMGYRLQTKLGGQENTASIMVLLAILVFGFFLFRVIGMWVSLLPMLGLIWFVSRKWSSRSRTRNYVLLSGAILGGLILAIIIFGFKTKASDTTGGLMLSAITQKAPFVEKILSFMSNDEQPETIEQLPTTVPAAPIEAPLEVVPFNPEHSLQEFSTVFTEGALAELTQIVGYINDATVLVQDAETQRSTQQANAPENQNLVLNVTVLLEGVPGETGIAKSQSVVEEWYETGVERADGTYESSSFPERVLEQQPQLEEEGANVNAILETAEDLNSAYANFVEMLKALQLNENNEVSSPNESKARLNQLQLDIANINGKLVLLGIDTAVLQIDERFVQDFLQNAERKEVTVEVTATPAMQQISEPVAQLVNPTAIPPTETPLPTNTTVPTPTTIPMGSIWVNVAFHDPYTPNVPLIGVQLFQGSSPVSELKTLYPGSVQFDGLIIGQQYVVAVFTDYPGLGCTGINGTHNVGDVASYTLAGGWYPCEDTRVKLNNGLAPVPPTPRPPVPQPVVQPTIVVNGTPVPPIQVIQAPINVYLGLSPRFGRRVNTVVLFDSGMNEVQRQQTHDTGRISFPNVDEGTYMVALSIPHPDLTNAKCFVVVKTRVVPGGTVIFSYDVDVSDTDNFSANCL